MYNVSKRRVRIISILLIIILSSKLPLYANPDILRCNSIAPKSLFVKNEYAVLDKTKKLRRDGMIGVPLLDGSVTGVRPAVPIPGLLERKT